MKRGVIIVLAVLIILLLPSCAESKISDKELEAELAKLTPEEREALLKDLELEEKSALAGQVSKIAKRYNIPLKAARTSPAKVRRVMRNIPLPSPEPQCGSDQECPLNYVCTNYKCTPTVCSNGICEASETPSSCPADCWKITTFGLQNTQEWKDNLPITGLRMGSSDSTPAAEPIANARTFVKDNNLKSVFITIYGPRDDAEIFSQESLSFPELEEVGIDDFVSAWWNKWNHWDEDLLNEFINDLKSSNPNLKFGITLYEYQLDANDLKDENLPKTIKDKVDYVHLYLGYSKTAENYESYVDKAKSMFPNAKIIAGSYAYDRIDYVPCSQSSEDHCTLEEELSYFEDSIRTQADLLKKGVIDSIEFAPAYFGNEDSMSELYFPSPKYCKTERKQECIENTKTMRAAASSVLNCYKIGAC